MKYIQNWTFVTYIYSGNLIPYHFIKTNSQWGREVESAPMYKSRLINQISDWSKARHWRRHSLCTLWRRFVRKGWFNNGLPYFPLSKSLSLWKIPCVRWQQSINERNEMPESEIITKLKFSKSPPLICKDQVWKHVTAQHSGCIWTKKRFKQVLDLLRSQVDNALP